MVKEKLRDLILITLEAAVDYSVDLADYYSNPKHFSVHWQPRYSKSALSTAISRLRKKGFVEKTIDEGKVILKLTEAGREWLFFNKSDDLIEWDGIWRLVIFDIPEKHARVRDILRRRLKEWGFNIWQKSVWASKKPLTEHLRKLVKDLKVEDWVLVMESNNVGK